MTALQLPVTAAQYRLFRKKSTSFLIFSALLLICSNTNAETNSAATIKYSSDMQTMILNDIKEHRLSAEAGNVNAMIQLAEDYTISDPPDETQTLKWYMKAAELGNSEAMFQLADILYEKKSINNAKEWYEKAASAGNSEAMYRLSAMYSNGDLAKDEIKSLDWLQKSAISGNSFTMYLLGNYFLFGTNPLLPKDTTKAIEWLTKAANKNNLSAIFQLASAYTNGIHIQKDEALAQIWTKKALEQGGPSAACNLNQQIKFEKEPPMGGIQAVKFLNACNPAFVNQIEAETRQ